MPGDSRALDEELARIAAEEKSRSGEGLSEREHGAVAKDLLDAFFNIWIRFAVDLGKELQMSPWQWDFVIYEGGKRYSFRDGFHFSRVNEVRLEEPGRPFRQVLKGEIRTIAGRPYIRVAFELEEGREYDLPGTVATRTSYVVYSEPAKSFTLHSLKKALAEPLRAWIRAELRADPSVLWDFCQGRLRKGR